jgi:hypothetical protein
MSKRLDLINQKFGKLLVLHKTENPKNQSKRTFWLCKCDCGEESIVSTTDLSSGKTTQCWKCAHEATGKHKRINLIGNRYGKLVVKDMIYGEKDKSGKQRTYCNCLCDCGNEIVRLSDSLLRAEKNGSLCSCGCGKREAMDKISIDIIGKKFGNLTVLSENKDISPRMIKCLCDCGKTIEIKKTEVMSGHTKSCGCLNRIITSISNTKDWTNIVSDYGVRAIKQEYINKHGQWIWSYECPVCHNYFVSLPAWVNSGRVTSCGCSIMSSGERLIKDFLEKNKVKFETQWSTDDCKYKSLLRFDFALLDSNNIPYYLIEYNGKQHYEPIDFFGGEEQLKINQTRDNIKKEYCNKTNIPLLELKYDLSVDEIKEKLTNIIYP